MYLKRAILRGCGWPVIMFLLVFSQSTRFYAVPPAGPVNVEPLPARNDRLSELRLLFNDDDEQVEKADNLRVSTPSQSQGRYFFGLLDRRSKYGKDFFPDPFLGPEFDRETQLEVDYLHGERPGARKDEGDVGLQWNPVGQLTLAGELGYDSEHQSKVLGSETVGDDDKKENGRGFENVDLALYHPVFQAVSRTGTLDYTATLRLDVGIPTQTATSGTDFQLTPYFGQLLRVGEHVSVEAWTGSLFTVAAHQADQFIYGASFGYQILRRQVSLPFTQTVTPLLEFDGQLPFSRRGQNALFGVAGFNWQFTGRGDWQPRLSFGCEFPIIGSAREQLHWGLVTQLFLEF